MPTEFTIIDIRTLPSADPLRSGKLDAIVIYQTDPMHTYTVTLPKDDLTDAKLSEAFARENAERAKYIGKKLVV